LDEQVCQFWKCGLGILFEASLQRSRRFSKM
jgi:hypothetical protein